MFSHAGHGGLRLNGRTLAAGLGPLVFECCLVACHGLAAFGLVGRFEPAQFALGGAALGGAVLGRKGRRAMKNTMSLTKKMSRLRAACAAAALSVAGLGLGQAALAQEHQISMVDANIRVFIDDVARITNYSFVIHPAVRGTVNVSSPVPLTEEEVFEMFLATMRTSDYAVIDAGPGKFKIMPDDAAVPEITAVGAGNSRRDQFVTEVIPLYHVDVQEAAQTVLPLVNGRGQITASASANRLVVVDYAGNIERIRTVIDELDRDTSIAQHVKLENMSAAEAAEVVTGLVQTGARGSRANGPGAVTAVAVPSANTVVLRGEQVDVQRMVTLVQQLDEAAVPTESLKVVYLKHAKAESVAQILEPIAQSMARPGETSAGMTIPFHEPTNSLVLSMDPQRLRAMEDVIAMLDIRQEQVLVEAIIVEISDQAARELGLQFLVAGTDDGSTTPFATSNFSRSTPSLLSLAGALVSVDDDSDSTSSSDLQTQAVNSLLGVNGLAFGLGGESNGTLFGAILNAVNEDSDTNVLSTPSVVALDNDVARIVAGQEVPVATGSVSGSDFNNLFTQITREEVGVKLEVQPTINDGDVVRLYIKQEVSSVDSFSASASGEPVFNTREIESTVLADNGEVIVLGGLIELTESQSATRVPILGSLPVIGRLFRSEGSSRTKTNLVVFIRPTILRDSDDNRLATARSYGVAREQMMGSGTDLDGMISEALGESWTFDEDP